VENDGTTLEGVLAAATADAVTVRFAGGERMFDKATIARADRLRDRNKDGFIKGVLFGAVLGLSVGQMYGASGGDVLKVAAVYGGIGWALDAAVTHRQPIYRAMPTTADARTVKLRFRF
jgi:hypothetical protein